MELLVRTLSGPPTASPLALQALHARFGMAGGRIGRSRACELALPAADRLVSREHAEVRWRHGQFMLKVISRVNAALVNGAVVPPGAAVALRHGDRIEIGQCLLGVELSPPAPAPGLTDTATIEQLLQGQDPLLLPLRPPALHVAAAHAVTPPDADPLAALAREFASPLPPVPAMPSASWAWPLPPAAPTVAEPDPPPPFCDRRQAERRAALQARLALLQFLSPRAIHAGQARSLLDRLGSPWHQARCWRRFVQLHAQACHDPLPTSSATAPVSAWHASEAAP